MRHILFFSFFLAWGFCFTSCSHDDLARDITSESRLDEPGEPCTVEGSCEGLFCGASVTCGCDESPECDCGAFRCSCDCEGKGFSHNVTVHAETPMVLSDMEVMLSGPAQTNTELANLKSLIPAFLEAIDQGVMEDLIQSSTAFENALFSLVTIESKSIMNAWFLENDIDIQL